MTTQRNILTSAVTILAAILASLLGGCFCGAGPGQTEASIYLTNAADGTSIAAATLTEDGRDLGATCQEQDANDPSRCVSERVLLSVGVHTIGISAPGYAYSTVNVDTTRSDSVHLAVALNPTR